VTVEVLQVALQGLSPATTTPRYVAFQGFYLGIAAGVARAVGLYTSSSASHAASGVRVAPGFGDCPSAAATALGLVGQFGRLSIIEYAWSACEVRRL